MVLVSEEHKKHLTFILAGYERDVEDKVFRADNGLYRRFPNKIVFEDYNAPELAEILKHMVAKLGEDEDETKKDPSPSSSSSSSAAAVGQQSPRPRYTLESELVAQAFGRRISRGAGTRGFGNGGLVETRLSGQILDNWRQRQLKGTLVPPTPTAESMVLTMDDVLGPPPSSDSGPVAEILAKLNGMVGLKSVKEAFAHLVERMKDMYWADRGDPLSPASLDAGLLNRIFMGNPGTGKTTVARLYGQLLRACGFLTYGDVVELKPFDFLGSVVGESEQNTKALVDRCAGKVMFIDEVSRADGFPEYFS